MSVIPQNRPCPCGSGKKYKRCCGATFTRSANKVMLDFDAKQFFRKYNFKELFLYLNAIICHPANTIYINRLEFLFAQLFAINAGEFKGAPLTQGDMQKLISGTNQSYNKLFRHFEDFAGFSQYNLIPLFFNNERYYFFYGNLERPYENYCLLIDRYFKDDAGYSFAMTQLKGLFEASLQVQTNLLEVIIENEKISTGNGNIYVPSSKFVEEVAEPLAVNQDFYNIQSEFIIHPGIYNNNPLQDLMNKSASVKLFYKTFFAEHNDKLFWMPPVYHIKLFMDAAREVIQQNTNLSLLEENIASRVISSCNEAFGISRTVIAFYTNGKKITSTPNHCIFADNNKLLLIKVAKPSLQDNVSTQATQATNELIDIIAKLRKAKNIRIELLTGQSHDVHFHVVEIIPIVFIDPLTFNVHGLLKKDKPIHTKIHFLILLDFEAIRRELQTGIEIIKFLKEEERIRNSSDLYPGEYIEKFAFYVQNSHAFLRTGQQFNSIIFSPHIWHDYIHEKLFTAAKDETVYLEIHRQTKGFYSHIDKMKNGVFRLTKTSIFSGAFLVPLFNNFLWIILPGRAQSLRDFEFEFIYDIVGSLFQDYLKKTAAAFNSCLINTGFADSELFLFFLTENQLDEPQFVHLNPIYKKTGHFTCISIYVVDRDQVLSYAILDSTPLIEKFSAQENAGERVCIESYITSIYALSVKSMDDSKELAAAFVDEHIPPGPRRYSAGMIPTENARLENYPPPYDFTDSDLALATRLISAYLIEQHIEPGVYKNKDALHICDLLYKKLLDIIGNELEASNSSVIPFVYRQVELGEGSKYYTRIKLQLRANSNLDYDLEDQYLEDDISLTTLTMTQRYLLHIAIKSSGKGIQIMSEEKWGYLLTLGKIASNISMLYDSLHHGLSESFLEIDDDYLLSFKTEAQHFDSALYQSKEASLTLLRYGKENVIPDIEENDNAATNESPFQSFKTAMDNAFLQEFGFRFEDMMFVLYAMKSSPFTDDGKFYPLVCCTLDQLISSIQYMDTQKMERGYIQTIISFLSIKEGAYQKDYLFFQSSLLKKKERILVSPLVQRIDGRYVYGIQTVYNAILNWENITRGKFPFAIPEGSPVAKIISGIHDAADKKLETKVYEKVKTFIPEADIVFRLSNFKRLSSHFDTNPACGEIDLLCINRTTKKIFVLEVKNALRRASNYHVKNSIRQFFLSNSSYYSKLQKKKLFVEENIALVLQYFGVADPTDYSVKELFVTHELQFAAFYNKTKIDFVLINELPVFILEK